MRKYLDRLIASLSAADRGLLAARLEGLVSVFPFNEYEYILMFLRDRSIVTFQDYENLRENYISANKYLNLFGLAPRIFGQVWGEQHLCDLDGRFRKGEKVLDPEYDGQYDLWIDGIRVEVKAARAIDTKKRGDLVSKALRSDSDRPFWMNFQQIKLNICDVFVFIGVWVDLIRYWVLTHDDIDESPHRSHQHRGGVEYQIGITNRNIEKFEHFLVSASKLADEVVRRGKQRQL